MNHRQSNAIVIGTIAKVMDEDGHFLMVREKTPSGEHDQYLITALCHRDRLLRVTTRDKKGNETVHWDHSVLEQHVLPPPLYRLVMDDCVNISRLDPGYGPVICEVRGGLEDLEVRAIENSGYELDLHVKDV